jgi:curved DNA-binding protein CbpA
VADLYEILGIAPTATTAEIRKAYLTLARDRHPDRFPDPAEKKNAQDFFSRATEAFNTLSNDKSRQQYDAERSAPKLSAPAEIAADAHRRGVQKLQERDYHEAVGLFQSAVQHAPDVARYHADLGRALANNPNWIREAANELDQAIRLDGKNAGYLYDFARLIAGQGMKLRAKRAIEQALRLAPDNPAVQQLAAELEVGGGTEPPPDPGPGSGAGGLLDRFRRKP